MSSLPPSSAATKVVDDALPLLFSDLGCPFTHRVLALLEHLGHQVERRQSVVGEKPEGLEKYSASRRIPVLVHDDIVLTESRVMLEHLAEFYEYAEAYPEERRARTLHRQAMAIMDLELVPMLTRTDDATVDESLLAEHLDALEAATSTLVPRPCLLAMHLAPLWLAFQAWQPASPVTRAIAARPALKQWLDDASALECIARTRLDPDELAREMKRARAAGLIPDAPPRRAAQPRQSRPALAEPATTQLAPHSNGASTALRQPQSKETIMKITNAQAGTNISEIASDIYRISTPVPPNPALPGGFTFNQFLIVDDEPLLFHTGPRQMFPLVKEAIESLMPLARLRFIGMSHFEADECGSLNEFLAAAPEAVPLCSMVAKMVSVDDVADREARGLGDGERLSLGTHTVQWLDTPHLPHGWECGYLFEESSKTLLCGDLFTQPGHMHDPLTEGDILESSEAMRAQMDYFSHAAGAPALLEKLAATSPTTLACMHGASWRGDGAAMLRRLSERLSAS